MTKFKERIAHKELDEAHERIAELEAKLAQAKAESERRGQLLDGLGVDMAEAEDRDYRYQYALHEADKARKQAEAEVAKANTVTAAMETFIDSCTYHMRGGDTVVYTGPRAERGTK
jgi:multidrug efflux pump subunit AcrA (membrane-fusion protein)